MNRYQLTNCQMTQTLIMDRQSRSDHVIKIIIVSSQNTCATIQEIFKNIRLFFSKQEWFKLVTCLLVYYCMKNGPDPKTLLPNCILHYYHASWLYIRNKINILIYKHTIGFDLETWFIWNQFLHYLCFYLFTSKQL